MTYKSQAEAIRITGIRLNHDYYIWHYSIIKIKANLANSSNKIINIKIQNENSSSTQQEVALVALHWSQQPQLLSNSTHFPVRDGKLSRN